MKHLARVATTDSNCKSMPIFFDPQGQLTPQSEVGTHIFLFGLIKIKGLNCWYLFYSLTTTEFSLGF